VRMILLTLIFAVWSSELIAEELKGTFYFDADTTYATKDSNTKIFEGNVVAIAPGTLVSADKITHNRELGILNATGHTILISNDQVFIGDDLEFKIDTQDITIKKATLVAKEVTYTQKIINDLLGFSIKEVEFEAARKERYRV
jgi:lipopolysaccharide assembly outer membrane protein LptD (OstA)